MKFCGDLFCAKLSDNSGRLLSFRTRDREMLCTDTVQPLLELRMLDDRGQYHLLTDADAYVKVTVRGEGCVCVLTDFNDFSGLEVRVDISAGVNGLSYTTQIQNDTDYFVESLNCPCVSIRKELRDNGGEGQILWPCVEGALISNADGCPRSTFRGLRAEDINDCARYMYPGAVNMQFLATWQDDDGLYIGAHDTNGIPKIIVPYCLEDGMRLEIRAFSCVAPHSNWTQGYPVVLEAIKGGWESGAERYREFIEEGKFPLPPKIRDNPDIPRWVEESPVVVIYPPRGVRGTGYMGPNEFFPYVNGLKYIDELTDDLQSKIMVFFPYWEGTAPWAPPFSWPPFGGEDIFEDFVEAMHVRGNLVALYSSGLHWTDKHSLMPEYDMSRFREKHGLTRAMCQLPDESLKPGKCIEVRTGYTMCCHCKVTQDIAYDQFGHMLDANVDYIQYFDQHIGGEGFICYAKEHGHPNCHGKWNTDDMRKIYEHIRELIVQKSGVGGAACGCEGAAGDYYCQNMLFNDLRWHANLGGGEPVPAYNYVLHEYTSNFMGNQCDFDSIISRNDNPDSLLYALAYSFIAGDALALVLKSGGEIIYEWGFTWLQPGPKQKPVKTFVRRLNAMRRGVGHPFLYGGRMLPKCKFTQPGQFVMKRRDGTSIVTGEVLSSCWQEASGNCAQIFVNFREYDVTVQVENEIQVVQNWDGEELPVKGNSFVVPALGCVISGI